MVFIEQGPQRSQVSFNSTDTIQVYQITHEQEGGAGLDNSKSLSSSDSVHFPEHWRGRVFTSAIHNSDIMTLVKYLFLTVRSFWDNWANTSANSAPLLKYRGEDKGWRAMHLIGPVISVLVLEDMTFIL